MKLGKTKAVIKIISFLLIFAILFAFVQDVLIKRSPTDVQLIPQFYKERENSLDAVYIGSSNCFTYWNSAVAFEEYGICVYPYSCNSQSFFAAKHLIKEARKTQKDAAFIVNINSITDDVVTVDAMHYLLDVMPMSANKLDLIDHLCDVGGYSLSERMEFYFPVIRFHSRTNEITPSDFSTKYDGLKGATTYYPYLNKSKDVSDSFVTTKEKAELSKVTVDYTNDLLDYCDEEKIKVVFVTVPQAKGKTDRIKLYNSLNEIIEKRGYPVLDLMEKADEIGIDMSVDFYNEGHTNIHGSIKYTNYLSKYLVKNYGFKDKRNDKEFNDWKISNQKYLNKVDSKILDVELDSAHRNFDLQIPSFKVGVKEKGIRISWSKSESADGYAVYRKDGRNGAWTEIAQSQGYGFTDTDVKKDNEYYYTVVPFSVKENAKYFGDYKYGGSKIQF